MTTIRAQTYLYPLRFEPVFREYIWGGRRLKTLLGKPIGDGDHYAESWEVVDHGDDQSRVAAGPLAGCTLHELVERYRDDLIGDRSNRDRFPLLLKFLDANRDLSVQVHPNDEQAARLNPPDYGKTEAWYVMHADEGAKIYCGLQPGVTRDDLVSAIASGAVVECLHSFAPQPNDCVFVPAGTVHALGAGLVVAELQQSSDVTYRLYDWGRTGPDGRPRELHVRQALEVIDFTRGPVSPVRPRCLEDQCRERLVESTAFYWDRWRFEAEPSTIGGDGSFHVLSVIEGRLSVKGDASHRPLTKGESMLVPAACAAEVQAAGGEAAVVLDGFLPPPS